MREAFVIAARRTPVAPRNGPFRRLEVTDLCAPPIRAVLEDSGLAPREVDDVILGNALYAGGNPARLAALAAGVPESVPALTVDTQCCAGLDAILLAVTRIRAGEAHAILAGGVESFSRSPLRARRPVSIEETAAPYDRPPFSPWVDRDPDLIEAAAALAQERRIPRDAQERFAMVSHAKAAEFRASDEIAPVAGLRADPFTRDLNARVCARMPVIAGDSVHGLTATTTAVEADAAAIVLIVSTEMLAHLRVNHAVRLASARRVGLDPAQPALGAQAAARPLIGSVGRAPAVVELMESFAAQAMAAIEDLGLDSSIVNRGGGALSRGHPIGASGAILAARLFHEMKREEPGAIGLAAIAAAGGLGAAAMFERV
ncbi:MAG: thiolase family protein [Beijerinckiaceae bacterium]